MENRIYLDVGCGRGKWGYLIKTSHKPPAYIVGIEVDYENVRFAKRFNAYDDLVVCDGRALPFRDGSFDIILCIEVIEHLKHKDGEKLLDEAERIAREKIVVSTPLLGARYWYSMREHVSKWTPSDLSKRGYTVRGVGFSFFGRFTTYQLTFALAPLAYYIPWMSYILLAWKNLDKKKVKQHEDPTSD